MIIRAYFGFNQVKKSLKIPKGYQNPYIEGQTTQQWPKEKSTRGLSMLVCTHTSTKQLKMYLIYPMICVCMYNYISAALLFMHV